MPLKFESSETQTETPVTSRKPLEQTIRSETAVEMRHISHITVHLLHQSGFWAHCSGDHEQHVGHVTTRSG